MIPVFLVIGPAILTGLFLTLLHRHELALRYRQHMQARRELQQKATLDGLRQFQLGYRAGQQAEALRRARTLPLPSEP